MLLITFNNLIMYIEILKTFYLFRFINCLILLIDQLIKYILIIYSNFQFSHRALL